MHTYIENLIRLDDRNKQIVDKSYSVISKCYILCYIYYYDYIYYVMLYVLMLYLNVIFKPIHLPPDLYSECFIIFDEANSISIIITLQLPTDFVTIDILIHWLFKFNVIHLIIQLEKLSTVRHISPTREKLLNC